MSSHLSLPIRPIRRAASMILLSAIALAACSSAAAPASSVNPTVSSPGVQSAVPTSGGRSVGPVPVPALVGDTSLTGGNTSGAPVGAPGAAIAYPYPIFGGSPGVAPDHSILVTGTGQAPLKADGSNAVAAERTALAAALAEAKRRADEVAAATGVTIHGVLSVSVSVGQNWIAPMGVMAPGGPATPPTSGPVPAPGLPLTPSPTEISVTVTVAYGIAS
jgi:hypothetical protein